MHFFGASELQVKVHPDLQMSSYVTCNIEAVSEVTSVAKVNLWLGIFVQGYNSAHFIL